MTTRSAAEQADHLSRRRARMLPFLAVIYLSQQVSFFADAGSGDRPVDHCSRHDLRDGERRDRERRSIEFFQPREQLGCRGGVDDTSEPDNSVARRAHRTVLTGGVYRRRSSLTGVQIGRSPP